MKTKATHIASAAETRLQSHLVSALSSSKPTGTLITGPIGSGKTTLARQVAQSAGYTLRLLDFTSLALDDTGLIEHAITTTFQPAQENNPVAILIEDLGVWAPAQPRTPSDFRIIASLGDELSALHESNVSIVFLATAASRSAVYPGLIREDRLGTCIELGPLEHSERISLCSGLLRQAFNIQEPDMLARQIAASTPGYVHTDMKRLFSRVLHEHIQDMDFSGSQMRAVDSLVMSWFGKALLSMNPSLLEACEGSLTSFEQGGQCHSNLYGLDAQIAQLSDYLQSTFPTPERTADKKQGKIYAVLQGLGACRGLILHGPTGCGKSAIANLCPSILPPNTVNFLKVDSTSLISSVIGEAERKLSDLFTIARAIAPSVVVIDNIDILAPNRDMTSLDGSSSAESFNRLLSTILTEIDGVPSKNHDRAVAIIGTTRSLKLLDPALLRPGRLELHIGLRAPDADARAEILRSFLESRGKVLSAEGSLSLERFRAESENWTAPDITAYGRELLLEDQSDAIMAVELCGGIADS